MGKRKGESHGLEYLKQVRPQAIDHLLKFFGESAKHLEPKTRFLISVVTKVINYSPRGIEQYVKRALQEGATPDEVIDAVLCSYPCAGLTKVVDAIDVILDMGLPGMPALAGAPAPAAAATTEAPEPGGRWIAVARLEEIPAGGALHVVAGAHEIALFNVNGRLLAVDHLCPHKHGPIAGGAVAASEDARAAVVTCPLHAWRFDLTTGESVNHPGARLRTYRARTVDTAGAASSGSVEVWIPS